MVSINRLSRCLKTETYTSGDVANWTEILLDADLKVNTKRGYATFEIEDIRCALMVREDGIILEYIDIDPDETLSVIQSTNSLDTDVVPNTYADYTTFRSETKQNFKVEALNYEKAVLAQFS